MEFPSEGLLAALNYLLPGFVSAWIFFGLTAYPRRSPFERIVQALIFTAFAQAFVVGFEYILLALGRSVLESQLRFVVSLLIAIIIGLLAAFSANSDVIHRLLRKMRITRETSLPSEWYGNLAENATFVVLHLSGERRLYGWPREWPSRPDSGHFVISEAEWLDEDGGRVSLSGVESVLISASEVELVEFVKFDAKPETEENHGQKKTESATAESNP